MANLNDLTNLVATKMDITKKDAKEAIQTVFEMITDQLVAGETVSIPGFGKFTAVEKEARDCRNPQSGETIHVAAHRSPKFSASSVLKSAVK